ncbi:MAG: phosphoribosylglycinamide formyltransferase [Solirubrobacteraceae bacterium]
MRVGVLASGFGSNLGAILEHAHGRDGVEVVAVGSDRVDAFALQRAREAGIATRVFELDDFADRVERDLAMAEWLTGAGVELVVLAGYMQLVTPGFLQRFPDRVINVHPALLPAFPGLHAVDQALAYGVKVFGVTVHYVDEGVDSGPIITQRAVELPEARSADDVMMALRPLEHELLTGVVRAFARDQA